MNNVKATTYTFETVTDKNGGKLIITGVTSSIGIKYVELQYSQDFLGKSEKTCRREINKIKSKDGIQKKYWSKAVIIQGKTFISRYLIEKREKKKRTSKAKSLIDGYIQLLSSYKWDIAGSVRYKFDKNLEENRMIMDKFDASLKSSYGRDCILFYVIEPNDILFSKPSDPHHNHYLIAFNKDVDIEKEKIGIGFRFLYDKKKDTNSHWCDKYNSEKGYVKYLSNKIKPNRDNYSLCLERDLPIIELEPFINSQTK